MHKKQTLEEAAENYAQQNASGYFVEQKVKAFKDGAKWNNNIVIKDLENCLKQPISNIGNIDYQKGYKQSIEDFIYILTTLEIN